MLLASALLLLQSPPQLGPDVAQVSPARLRSTLNNLCQQVRFAGSKDSQHAIDYATTVFQEAGLRVEHQRYLCYLPRQTDVKLWLLQNGQRTKLDLIEHGYPEDQHSQRNQVAPMHGLTQAGHVRGQIVFAGRGKESDFALLKEQGVELAGKIALIRYGGLYRGLKVKNAADAGCVGALLYTDPDDDGSSKGAVLPNGKWRPHDGIQRGSVYNGDGDALTPGIPALEDAPRISPRHAEGLVSIPSIPISWTNAALLFAEEMRPTTIGLLNSHAEFQVEQDPAPVWIENVIGWLDADDPNADWVLAGAHRDAWGFGAVDNGTGTAVLLEAARVLGAAKSAGWKPERSIALATWDAEEWGLVGSTEWVEHRRSDLMARAVAYLNMDVVASGPNFGASCTPGLVEVLNRACALEGINPPQNLGVPGGGSDHVPFLEIAGVEVSSFGFHGGSGAYHSAYDTPYLIEKFLDPNFEHHRSATRILLRMLTDLANENSKVDGLHLWAMAAKKEAEKLQLNKNLKGELLNAITDFEAKCINHNSEYPHRFLRLFLPTTANERLSLWQTAGYGADWFPQIKAAIDGEQDPGLATKAMTRIFQRAARLVE